jgi:hypothetical protein
MAGDLNGESMKKENMVKGNEILGKSYLACFPQENKLEMVVY